MTSEDRDEDEDEEERPRCQLGPIYRLGGEDGDGPVVLDLRTDRATPLQTAVTQARISSTARRALMMTLTLGMCATTAPTLGLEMEQDHLRAQPAPAATARERAAAADLRPAAQEERARQRHHALPRRGHKPKVDRNRRRARAAALSRAKNR